MNHTIVYEQIRLLELMRSLHEELSLRPGLGSWKKKRKKKACRALKMKTVSSAW